MDILNSINHPTTINYIRLIDRNTISSRLHRYNNLIIMLHNIDLYDNRQIMHYSITTIGCKINQYESQSVSGILLARGWKATDSLKTADLSVINTCCVTARAMQKSRRAIRRTMADSSGKRLIIIGCYSTYHASRIREILAELSIGPEQALVIGHHEDVNMLISEWLDDESTLTDKTADDSEGWKKHEIIPETLVSRRNNALRNNTPGTRNLPPINRMSGRQRAFVKIQDGCDCFCSYCIVPFTRPSIWSKSCEQIENECRYLLYSGHREIVLCGACLGLFGRNGTRQNASDDHKNKLADLLRQIASLDGLWRVRLSSIDPHDITDDLLNVAAKEQTVAPHFHIPLQSGSDKILAAMNRRYTSEDYLNTVHKINKILYLPSITTDIIVGYPGETEADFQSTLQVAEKSEFSKIHIFPFSPVEPTAAWKIRDQAPARDITADRIRRLVALEKKLASKYRSLFKGKHLDGIVESKKDGEDQWIAMTDRYLQVSFTADLEHESALHGKVVRLQITDESNDVLKGTIDSIL